MPSLSRIQARWAVLVLGLLSVALYLPSLDNTYARDDRYIAMAQFDDGTPNRFIAELLPFGDYFGAGYWESNPDIAAAPDPLYRPVTVISIAWLHSSFGGRITATEEDQARPQHLLNLLLHGVGTWLCYLLLRRAGAGYLPALAGTLAFATHAIHSEVVASVVGRAELLAFALGASGILCALRPTFGRGLGAALLLFLAFGSKETALAWAPFLWVYLAARTWRQNPDAALRGTLLRTGKHAALVAAVPLIVFFVLRGMAIADFGESRTPAVINPLVDMEFAARQANALMIWAYGLLKCLWPFSLRSEYSAPFFTMAEGFFDLRVLGAVVLLGGVLAGGLRAHRHAPLLFCGMAAFLGFSFISSNVPRVIGTVFGERLYFLPSLGLSFAVAGVGALLPRRPAQIAAAALGLWCLVGSTVAWQRAGAWQNDDTLTRADAEDPHAPARTLQNYAELLQREQKFDAMLQVLERVRTIYPHLPLTWNLLGTQAIREGDPDRALAHFRQGLACRDITTAEQQTLAWNIYTALLQKQFRKPDPQLAAPIAEARRKARELDPVKFLRSALSALGPFLASGDLGPVPDLLAECALVDERLTRQGILAVIDPPTRPDVALSWWLRTLDDLGARSEQPGAWRGLRGRLAQRYGELQIGRRDLEAAAAEAKEPRESLKASLWLADLLIQAEDLPAATAVLDRIDSHPQATRDIRAGAQRLRASMKQ